MEKQLKNITCRAATAATATATANTTTTPTTVTSDLCLLCNLYFV